MKRALLILVLLYSTSTDAAVSVSRFTVTASKPTVRAPVATPKAQTADCTAVRVNLSVSGKVQSYCVINSKWNYNRGINSITATPMPDPLFKSGFEKLK